LTQGNPTSISFLLGFTIAQPNLRIHKSSLSLLDFLQKSGTGNREQGTEADKTEHLRIGLFLKNGILFIALFFLQLPCFKKIKKLEKIKKRQVNFTIIDMDIKGEAAKQEKNYGSDHHLHGIELKIAPRRWLLRSPHRRLGQPQAHRRGRSGGSRPPLLF
jgi:hypothetical protein